MPIIFARDASGPLPVLLLLLVGAVLEEEEELALVALEDVLVLGL